MSVAVEADDAAVGRDEPHERVAQGRLAHAIAADDAARLRARSRTTPRRAPAPCRSPSGQAVDGQERRWSGRAARLGSAQSALASASEVDRVHVLVVRGSDLACRSRPRRPSAITTTRSATLKATSMSCSMRSRVSVRRQLGEQLDQPLALTPRQAGGGFVEQHDRRDRTRSPCRSRVAALCPCERSATLRADVTAEPDPPATPRARARAARSSAALRRIDRWRRCLPVAPGRGCSAR